MQHAISTVVYLASGRDHTLRVFALLDGGQLELVQRLPVGETMTPLAVTPDRRFLYVGLRGEPPGVATFAIAPTTGKLQQVGRVALPDPPMYLATDARGTSLLAASYAGASYTVMRIAGDGSVLATPVQHETSIPRAHAIVTDPTNRFLYVTALGSDSVVARHFNARTARSTPNTVLALPAGCGPRHAVFHPNGRMLYLNGELDGRVYALALDAASGHLRVIDSQSMLAQRVRGAAWAAEIALTPDGRYLFASERHSNTLARFALTPDGGFAQREIIATEQQPRTFAIDPRGRFVLVAGELSNHLSIYALDAASGALRPKHRYPAGDKPVWLTVVDLP